jgi:hypothetical protein
MSAEATEKMDNATRRNRATAFLPTVGLVFAGSILFTGAARAGDYAHHCRSADGNYAMSDEELKAVNTANGRETGRAIPYKVLRKFELRKTAGFCIARNAPKGQRRFPHAATTYALHIRFRRNGQRIKTFMLCEMASSGLPASYNCDREVQTLDWTARSKVATVDTTPRRQKRRTVRWMHNGSEVRIVAKGPRRQVVFVSPNENLARLGVTSGDPIFEGRREGNRYIGQAFVYSKNCAAKTYKVDGRVHKGERRVVVFGRKPIADRDCRTDYHEDVRLVFDRE